MKFVIRDDDTNYFTTPDELNKAYSDVWRKYKVSLAVVPFIMGDWRKWVNELEFNRESMDYENYMKDDVIYPIGDNESLVLYLKELIRDNKVSIMLHGIHHRNKDPQLPQVVGNYSHPAEFLTSRNLTEPLARSKQYLENIFDVQIKYFCAPQNLLSDLGQKAVLNCNLNLIRDFGSRELIKWFADIPLEVSKSLLFKLRFHKEKPNYYHGIKFNNNLLFPHNRLQPLTDLSKLKSDFDFAYKNGELFILSTHYYALADQRYYEDCSKNGLKITMKNKLHDFLEFVDKYENIEPIHANEMKIIK